MTELGNVVRIDVVRIDDERIADHLGKIVRGSIEDTLNALLEAEADRLVGAERYARGEGRRTTAPGTTRVNCRRVAAGVLGRRSARRLAGSRYISTEPISDTLSSNPAPSSDLESTIYRRFMTQTNRRKIHFRTLNSWRKLGLK